MSFYPPIAALLTTVSLITLILRSRFVSKIQDIPNERSLHSNPTPRIGGVGLMAGTLAGWAPVATSQLWWLELPLLGLFIVSLLDDIRSLSVRQRLSAHLAAAVMLAVGSGLVGEQGLLIGIVVVVLTVWMTNLFNFMDGSDGLAGGMALFGFGFYGIAALMSGDDSFAMMNFSVAAAALGFLFSNFYPAKIFMGDAGSIPLGFLAAAMGLWGWQQDYWEAWFPLLVFSPFIADASITLLKRTLRGASITEAHREHYYQRLVQMGWGHRSVALVEYALMLGVGLSALNFVHEIFPLLVSLAWIGIFAAVMLIIDMAWKKSGLERHV